MQTNNENASIFWQPFNRTDEHIPLPPRRSRNYSQHFMKCLLCNSCAHSFQSYKHFMRNSIEHISRYENDFNITWFMEIFPYIITMQTEFIGKSACGNFALTGNHSRSLCLFASNILQCFPAAAKLCKFNYFEWRKWNFIALSMEYNRNKMQAIL